MNVCTCELDIAVEENQVTDVVLGFLHTSLYIRCLNKFHYSEDKMKPTETNLMPFVDVDATTANFSYIRVNCDKLQEYIGLEVKRFKKEISQVGTPLKAKFSIEYYTRKNKAWVFTDSHTSWEIVNINLDITAEGALARSGQHDIREVVQRQFNEQNSAFPSKLQNNESVPLFEFVEERNLAEYFDCSYTDIQVPLFKLNWVVDPTRAKPTYSMKGVFKEILSS